MSEIKKSVLFISSADPFQGAGSLVVNYADALRKGGYDVDILTKYKVKGENSFLYIKEQRSKYENPIFKIWRRLSNIKPGYCIFYRKESHPPVSVRKVIGKIKKKYDVVIIFFWQELLSYKSVEAIYDKLGEDSLIMFLCADYSPMTGACHFFNDCRRYAKGCGKCIMLNSTNPKDFTAWNAAYRRKVNEKIKPIVLLNTYMFNFFRDSFTMKGARFEIIPTLINLNLFKPLDKVECRKLLNIIPVNGFVLFFGSFSLTNPNKGIEYLLNSLDYFYEILDEKERQRVIVVMAGNNSEDIIPKIKFKSYSLGYIPTDQLPEVYSASDVFLSPSIHDAGPSMVNQAIACGTPVIAFEIGTALDIIKDQGTGICVPTKDHKAFGEAIYSIYSLNAFQKASLTHHCREIALSIQSDKAFLSKFNEIIGKYTKK